MKLLKLDNSYQNMVLKVGDEMDFDKKIKDKNLIIYCSNNLEDFAYEFKEYYYKNIKNIKESLDITEEIKIIVALTDKIGEANFVYGKSSFSGFFTDTGAFAYISLNEAKIKEYMFKGLMHEIVHYLYKYYVYGAQKDRIVWVDEGIAQLLSGQKDEFQDDSLFKEFVIKNIKDLQNFNLNTLDHKDKSFGNKNGYNLSYIALKYLHDNFEKQKFLEIIKDENALKQLGTYIIDEIKNNFVIDKKQIK